MHESKIWLNQNTKNAFHAAGRASRFRNMGEEPGVRVEVGYRNVQI